MSNARFKFGNTSNDNRLTIDQMSQHLLVITGGWPKVISSQLSVPARSGGFEVLNKPEKLFAFIERYADVDWRRMGIPKGEFFAGLGHYCDHYTYATAYPHFPAIPNVLYTTAFPEAANTGCLDYLVSHFSPATEIDQSLIKAYFLTLFWGGPAGKRPVFAITSDTCGDARQGRGSAKTTLAEIGANLVGGLIELQQHGNADRRVSTLLSPSSFDRRVGLFDNVKSFRMSSGEIESLITCTEITGHKLYHGFAARPNFLTYVITMNGTCFSTDISQRSVMIKLRQPRLSSNWYDDTMAFINTNRQGLYADARWHLECVTPYGGEIPDRWSNWWRDVAGKIGDVRVLSSAIECRRSEIDTDREDQIDAVEHLTECLRRENPSQDIESHIYHIDTMKMTEWLRSIQGPWSNRPAQFLKQLSNSRFVQGRTSNRRFYRWVGSRATAEQQPIDIRYCPRVS